MKEMSKRQVEFAAEKVGTEFLLHTFTTNAQLLPSVASLGDERYVTVWQSDQIGSSAEVYGQIFDSDGQKVFDETRANVDIISGGQAACDTAAFNSTHFVVVWAGNGDFDSNGIHGRVFMNDWETVGSRFTVNTLTDDTQELPRVATVGDSTFVVVWGSFAPPRNVAGQVYSIDGPTKVGGEFTANTEMGNIQRNPAVASVGSSRFVVVWQSEFQDGDGFGIYGQVFNDNGSKSGGEFQVNSVTQGAQVEPAVTAIDALRFLVAWQGEGGDSESHIIGQLFDINAEKIGSEVQISNMVNSTQSEVSLAAFGTSQVVAVYMDDFYPARFIYAQVLDGSAGKISDAILVNAFTEQFKGQPRVASITSSDFMVVWGVAAAPSLDSSSLACLGQLMQLTEIPSPSPTPSVSLSPTISPVAIPPGGIPGSDMLPGGADSMIADGGAGSLTESQLIGIGVGAGVGALLIFGALGCLIANHRRIPDKRDYFVKSVIRSHNSIHGTAIDQDAQGDLYASINEVITAMIRRGFEFSEYDAKQLRSIAEIVARFLARSPADNGNQQGEEQPGVISVENAESIAENVKTEIDALGSVDIPLKSSLTFEPSGGEIVGSVPGAETPKIRRRNSEGSEEKIPSGAKFEQSPGGYLTRGEPGDNSIELQVSETEQPSQSDSRAASDQLTRGSDIGDISIPSDDISDLEKINEGGGGTVFKAQLRKNTDVALKQIKNDAGSSKLANEVKHLINLSHKNIVQFYGVWKSKKGKYIVLDYMEAGSLWDLLHNKTSKTLNWSQQLKLGFDVGVGLDYIHSKGVVHRDLKSPNVLISLEGADKYRAKITDFGLAGHMSFINQSKDGDSPVGTTRWMAPECLGVTPKYDKKSDVYSYGVVLWEIVTREKPYPNLNSEVQIAAEIATKNRNKIPNGMDKGYAALLGRCWAKRDQRPAADEVVAELKSIGTDAGVSLK